MTKPLAKRKLIMGLSIAAALAATAAVAGYAARDTVAALFAPHAGGTAHAASDGAYPAGYTCAMHSHLVLDAPGACPVCGMTLVKIGANQGGHGHGAAAPGVEHAAAQQMPQVFADAATQQRMGVRLAEVEFGDMHKEISAYATISPDESRSVSVNPKVEGWIRKFYIQGPGQAVRRGQVLYEIYSPELQQRQREYLDMLQRRDALLSVGGGAKMELNGPNSAMMSSLAKERFRLRDRLLAADMPPELLEKIEKDRRVIDVVPVLASQDGSVLSVSARAGSYVNPSETVLVYADFSRIWAELTLFPDQVSWLRNGDAIELSSGLDRNVRVTGKVDLANLQIDGASRTARLRLPLDNRKQAFRPGVFADAVIRSSARQTLSVPRDALIRTGHGDFVVRSDGGNHFRNVEVKTGIEDRDNVEIVSGLRTGDQVAVNAQFLLDAAGSLQAMQQRQAPSDVAAPAAVSTTMPAAMPAAMPMAAPAAHGGHGGHGGHAGHAGHGAGARP